MDARKFRRCAIHESMRIHGQIAIVLLRHPLQLSKGYPNDNKDEHAYSRHTKDDVEQYLQYHTRRDLCLCTRIRCSSRQPTHRHPFLY